MVSDRLSSVGQGSPIIKYFVSNLNSLTKCLLHWFPSTSECEKITLHKLLHWTLMFRFSDETSALFPITL